MCRGDGIGRRRRLIRQKLDKIFCPYGRVGSSPALGTIFFQFSENRGIISMELTLNELAQETTLHNLTYDLINLLETMDNNNKLDRAGQVLLATVSGWRRSKEPTEF